jgi:hypothetical protein
MDDLYLLASVDVKRIWNTMTTIEFRQPDDKYRHCDDIVDCRTTLIYKKVINTKITSQTSMLNITKAAILCINMRVSGKK